MKSILTLCILLLSMVSFGQISNGLVFDFDMNGDAVDLSGNGLHGVPNGLTATSDAFGVADSALHFNGSGNIELPNDAQLKPPLPLTVSFLVKIDQYGLAPLYWSDALYNDYAGFIININPAGQIAASIGGYIGGANGANRRTYVSDVSLILDKWYRVTVIINAYDDMRIFFDCEESPGSYNGSGPTSMVYSNMAGKIGEGGASPILPNGTNLFGSLDRVRLWNRALTTAEALGLCEGSSVEVDEIIGSNLVKVYPNPSSSTMRIQLASDANLEYPQVILVNSIGQKILESRPIHNSIDLDVSKFPSGLYLLSVVEKGRVLGHERIVIN